MKRYTLFVLHRPTGDWWPVDTDDPPANVGELRELIDYVAGSAGVNASDLAVQLVAVVHPRQPAGVELS